MARYILLAVEDDEIADVLVEDIQEQEKTGRPFIPVGTTVRAVFKMPTIFCECSGVKGRAWTRGKKYGWLVCTNCKRPAEKWAHGDAWFVALGVNLLPIQIGADEYRGPLHKQHPGYGAQPAVTANLAADNPQVWERKAE